MSKKERLVLWANNDLRVVAVKGDCREEPVYVFEEGETNAMNELVYIRARTDSTVRDRVLDAILQDLYNRRKRTLEDGNGESEMCCGKATLEGHLTETYTLQCEDGEYQWSSAKKGT